MRYSKQREMIENVVRMNKIHPTADQVYDILKQDNPNLSLGTVYRNLNQLADSGEILRLNMKDGKCRYDGDVSDHCHVICDKCGKIFDIEIPNLKEYDNYVEKNTNVSVTSRQMIFNGVCNICKKN